MVGFAYKSFLQGLLKFKELAEAALEKGVRVTQILALKSKDSISNAKFEKDYNKVLNDAVKDMEKEFAQLKL